MSQKLKHFGDVKQHFGDVKQHLDLERTVMKVMVPGRRGRAPPAGRCTWDIKETIAMKVHETQELARNQQIFMAGCDSSMFCKGLAT